MQCRPDCGACCIAPSISSPIPGMPQGKPANVRCVQLSPDNRCQIFGSSLRPAVCGRLQPSLEMCFTNRHDAMTYLVELETSTAPSR
ncbi:YkgJ family cysteine cluster protein [Shimwellia pseudoproteus]|uniref:YkgJ family cysteine cluster protein n=1 Tax=Shimwellia pseudoproteus TaxID=570012 RepID=UPI0018EBB984|nr:YkgJ family cysteine cluster protein [Shimwellia pseudoproteus]MBJ3816413.1 YkgJ family cysteine cluster protein [Shimwellia pseudoproteus]